jgi:hypothetical protein
MQEQNQEWIPMVEAAKQFKISSTKVSRLAKQGKIEIRNKWGDERVKLVNIDQLREYMDRAARGQA